MDLHLLSRITKDYLNLDPDLIPSRDRYRAGWGGSILAPHEKALGKRKENLLKERKRAETYRNQMVDLKTAPKISPPEPYPLKKITPAVLFSRGASEKDKKKNPEPIRELLTETDEFSIPRPVPGNFQLIRSISKGKGTLRQTPQGLVYLSIDNRFIELILPFLKSKKLFKPPYFNPFSDLEGAHIPVIPQREAKLQYLDSVEELGNSYSFTIEGLYSTKPFIWPEVEEAWFFKAHSPELELLRKKYFLPEHPNGHPFHIVVAMKPSFDKKPPPPLMRVNAAIFAA